MGRRGQLEQTLPQNLAVLERFPEFELVLIDYNSPDGLAEWVLATCGPALESGRLRFYRTTEPAGYVMTHAKNIAHLAAGGEIVTNLDGDNFLTDPYLRFLRNVFEERKTGVFLGYNGPGIGSRISVRKDNFIAAGGYDEDLGIGWGPDDFDLAFRLHHLGLRRLGSLNVRLFGEALSHPDEGRNEFTPGKLSKYETHKRNLSRIIENGKARKFIANQGRRWGEITLTKLDGTSWRLYAQDGKAVFTPVAIQAA